MDATNTIVPIIESVFSDWESHDANFAPDILRPAKATGIQLPCFGFTKVL